MEVIMSKIKTKFFGNFDIDDDFLKDTNTKINIKGNAKDIIISFIGLVNYLNFGDFNNDIYLDYLNRFIKLLDKYTYINNIGKNEIIKSYRQRENILERFDHYFSGVENSINELLISDNKISLKNVIEILDIKKIVKLADPPNIGLDLDKNGNMFVVLQYNLVFIGIVSIRLDEQLKLKHIGYEYFRNKKLQ
jgi:hypothetical protein